MYSQLETLKTVAGNNFGGGYKIALIPKGWATESVTLYIDKVTGVVSADFLNTLTQPPVNIIRPFFLSQSISYTEKETIATSGHSFDCEIKATLLGYDTNNAISLNNLRYHEFIILYQGANYDFSVWKIIGDKDRGMKLTTEFDSGNSLKDLAAYTLTFDLKTENTPPFIYLPDF